MSTSLFQRSACLELTLIVLVMVGTTHGGSVIHVDDDAPPGGDGTSWDVAYRFLQDALTDAAGGGIAEIRVGQGVHKADRDESSPNGTGDREATFQLLSGVALMGGYAGIGADDPDAHDIERYETILSGDLLGNDGPNFENNGENSLHVVTGSGAIKTAVLDGFTITAGNANSKAPFKRGAGMFNENSSAVVSHCVFRKHQAQFGAAMSNAGGSPTISDCVFIDNIGIAGAAMENRQDSQTHVLTCLFTTNIVSGNGGAVLNNDGSSTTFVDCNFVANSASEANRDGGAMVISECEVEFTDCNFTGNVADHIGGAISAFQSNIELTGCAFTENSAEYAGAFLFDGIFETLILSDCEFVNNTSIESGGAVECRAQQFVAADCTFAENSSMTKWGGGLHLIDSNGLLIRCRFVDNSASLRGGGLLLREAEPLLVDCVFVGNSANEGGGLAIDPDSGVGGTPVIIGTSFFANVATSRGGAVYERRSNTEPLFVNCRFYGNSSGLDGGAIHNNEQGSANALKLHGGSQRRGW